ncbi:hypothetical protein [Geobacter sp.]|uniref:hypothetical protein n=1 Tax=Geobacter sp. TaxID=46610 RepID=UPI002639CCF4|nr:hypothetical protein [Geobacter sp.]
MAITQEGSHFTGTLTSLNYSYPVENIEGDVTFISENNNYLVIFVRHIYTGDTQTYRGFVMTGPDPDRYMAGTDGPFTSTDGFGWWAEKQ